MKNTIFIVILSCVVGCGKQTTSQIPEALQIGASNSLHHSDLSKETWADAGPLLAERTRRALCPTELTNMFTVEYIDSTPSVEVRLGCNGYRVVFSANVFKHLADSGSSLQHAPRAIIIKEYIELVLFPIEKKPPEDSCKLIPWSGFTSFYHVQPVDMGTGMGFRWFGRMHLWEQDDIRERLGLTGGIDRLELARLASSIKDPGNMTANSIACRMNRFKPKEGIEPKPQGDGKPAP